MEEYLVRFQAEGLDATFLCQLPTAGIAIEWQINGTSFHSVNAGEGQVRREGRGDTEALIIPALNTSTAYCTRFFILAVLMQIHDASII